MSQSNLAIPHSDKYTPAQLFNKFLGVRSRFNIDPSEDLFFFHINSESSFAYAHALYPSLFSPDFDGLCVPVSQLAWSVSDTLSPSIVASSKERAECLAEEVSIAALHALAEIYPSRDELTTYLRTVTKERLDQQRKLTEKTAAAARRRAKKSKTAARA
jgi:hypothetical protein